MIVLLKYFSVNLKTKAFVRILDVLSSKWYGSCSLAWTLPSLHICTVILWLIVAKSDFSSGNQNSWVNFPKQISELSGGGSSNFWPFFYLISETSLLSKFSVVIWAKFHSPQKDVYPYLKSKQWQFIFYKYTEIFKTLENFWKEDETKCNFAFWEKTNFPRQLNVEVAERGNIETATHIFCHFITVLNGVGTLGILPHTVVNIWEFTTPPSDDHNFT